MEYTVYLILLLAACQCSGDSICAFSRRDPVKVAKANDDVPLEDMENGNSTEKCSKGPSYCYSLWQDDPYNKSIVMMLAQGCWDNAGEHDCGTDQCISKRRPPKAMNHTKFCCCLGNFCNVNVSDEYDPNEQEYSEIALSVEQASYDKETLVIVLALVCTITVSTIVGFFIFRFYSGSRKPSPDPLHMIENAPMPSPKIDLTNMKVQELIGRGRYGCVYKATLNDSTVAVKVFSHQNRHIFWNERSIYSLPYMEHPNIARFFGSEEKVSDGKFEYCLVLSHAPLGCLQDYLKENTLDWPTLCKMAQTVTRGLSHMHTDIKKGDKVKPCIAHRDLNSRNILVKQDGTCLLCDFGFAMRISGAKYYYNGEEQCAETTSLTDVGTVRYMAPEVLEGAVNLRECESSLKQIDIYALGLVVWEVASRCSDLYQGVPVPDYKLPFQAEVGSHPSFEQMQVLVTRHKARPLFPDIWKDTNMAVRALKETIEDCWDQDAEARLTVLCVEERLAELPVLWERHKAGINIPGVSPTVNPTTNIQCVILPNLTWCADDYSQGNKSSSTGSTERCNSVSENTTETILTSPSEPIPNQVLPNNNPKNMALCINNNNNVPKVTVPLQPHQGRNPCLERNLMKEASDGSPNGGNFLERGSKYNSPWPNSNSETPNEMFSGLSLPDSMENSSLVSNDMLNFSNRICQPIPYTQNAVSTANAIRKQPNVPGNGHKFVPLDGTKTKPKERSWFQRGDKKNKKTGWFWNRKCTQKSTVEEQKPLRDEHSTNLAIGGSSNKSNLRKGNNSKVVDTEVCLSSDQTVVQIASGAASSDQCNIPGPERPDTLLLDTELTSFQGDPQVKVVRREKSPSDSQKRWFSMYDNQSSGQNLTNFHSIPRDMDVLTRNSNHVSINSEQGETSNSSDVL